MKDHLTKLILTIAAVMAVTPAQAAEAETLVCPSSSARECPSSSPGRIIYVRPNSVTIWKSKKPFKQVFVGSAGSKTTETTTTTQTKTSEDRADLITATAADEHTLVLTVSEPKENLFGFGEAVIARGNVLLYDNGEEVAHLIVEVTPLNGPSDRVKLIQGDRFAPTTSFRFECDASVCYPAFKPREPTAVETRPDGTVRREYAPK
jgi:hypothetical protein